MNYSRLIKEYHKLSDEDQQVVEAAIIKKNVGILIDIYKFNLDDGQKNLFLEGINVKTKHTAYGLVKEFEALDIYEKREFLEMALISRRSFSKSLVEEFLRRFEVSNFIDGSVFEKKIKSKYGIFL